MIFCKIKHLQTIAKIKDVNKSGLFVDKFFAKRSFF